MTTSQTEIERDAFFTHLESLGESSGEDEVVVLNERHVKESAQVSRRSIPNLSRNMNNAHYSTTTYRADSDVRAVVPPSVLGASESLDMTKMDRVRTRASTSKESRSSKARDDINMVKEADRIFAGLTFFFIPNDDIAKPRKVRIRTAISYGAAWARVYDSTVTHVIVDHRLDFDAAQKALPPDKAFSDGFLVRDTWLIDSIAYKNIQRPLESRFKVKGAPDTLYQPIEIQNKPGKHSEIMPGKKRKLNEYEDCQSQENGTKGDQLDRDVREVQETSHLRLDEDRLDDHAFEDVGSSVGGADSSTKQMKECTGFQCMDKNDNSKENPNARTIEVLQEMATYYEQTGDRWRTLAYRKAIGALKKQTTLIRTREEALVIPQIGARLADKVEEIVTTNRLQKLENAQEDPDAQTLQLFMGIYGVGLVQATNWISQGFRSLEDLSKNAKLNQSQKVGIAHFEDFKQRIPRDEVAEHAEVVQKALRKVDANLDAIIGGSYRRGSSDSGDIDIIITKQDATMEIIRTMMVDSVIPSLEKSGFLKVALASSTSKGRGSKWHGASCLPDHTTWRRIDLLFVPWSELGAAMVYFTGNDIFNRSLRLLASRKGMRLNQHGLYSDIMRGKGRVKMNEGKLLEGHSEIKIFEILGVPWRPPEHRKC